MLDLRLEFFGDVQFHRMLLRTTDRARDMRPVWLELVADFYRIEEAQFDSQGGRSSAWAPLRPATLARKLAAGQDPRILQATRAMRLSLTRPNARGSHREMTADTLVISTRVKSKSGFPYPAAHQRPLRGQTRRRPVELTSSDRTAMVKKMQRYIFTGSTR